MTKRWASCKCFYKRNFYIKQLDEHFEYKNDQQFIFEYQNQLSGVNAEDVLNEIKTEMARRKKRFKLIEENRHNILEKYKPFSIDNFVGFTDLQTIIPKEEFNKVYKFSVMDSSLCDKIKEEIDLFKDSGLKHSRPNSMNKHGIILNEIGLECIVEHLLPSVNVLARELFPDLVGDSGLDSYKAFTIEYSAEAVDHQKDLGTHFDNAEVTLNVPLTDDHEGGELYFIRNNKMTPIQHQKGVGILHAGGELHGAMPLVAGFRTNLIIWFRSSSIRNVTCPMCGDVPDLEDVEVGDSTGDGFTMML